MRDDFDRDTGGPERTPGVRLVVRVAGRRRERQPLNSGRISENLSPPAPGPLAYRPGGLVDSRRCTSRRPRADCRPSLTELVPAARAVSAGLPPRASHRSPGPDTAPWETCTVLGPVRHGVRARGALIEKLPSAHGCLWPRAPKPPRFDRSLLEAVRLSTPISALHLAEFKKGRGWTNLAAGRKSLATLTTQADQGSAVAIVGRSVRARMRAQVARRSVPGPEANRHEGRSRVVRKTNCGANQPATFGVRSQPSPLLTWVVGGCPRPVTVRRFLRWGGNTGRCRRRVVTTSPPFDRLPREWRSWRSATVSAPCSRAWPINRDLRAVVEVLIRGAPRPMSVTESQIVRAKGDRTSRTWKGR